MNHALESVLGMSVLVAAGTAVASALYVAGLWKETLRPTRRTTAWALARGLPAAPDECGWTATEQRFPRADGGTTPAWVIQGHAPHSGRVAVVLHGHNRSRWDSLRRAGPWVERCALVVLPDLRGHGESEGRTTLGRAEVADMELLLAEVAALHPGARVVLAGHSMGAVVAIHAAARAAQRRSVPIEQVEAWGPYERVRTPFRAHVALRNLPVGPFPAVVLALLRLLDGPETPTTASAAAVAAPLVVHADSKDQTSPVAEAAAIAAATPQGTLHVTHGVPHADLGVPQPPATGRAQT